MESLAAVEDVLPLLRTPETEDDHRKLELIQHLLLEASDLIQDEAGTRFEAPAPGMVHRLAVRMVIRAINGEATDPTMYGATSLQTSAGPFSRSVSFAAGTNDGGVWLTKAERKMLRRYRRGAYSVQMW